MLDAAPDAGLFYVCTPNNPTGTLTSHTDIEQLVEKKPKDAIVLVDEAYLHFCDTPSAIDLVKADKDVIVLRTFSKLYGMAGLRCGFAVAKPDLLERIEAQGGWNAMPVTAVAAATASLKEPGLTAQRRRINAEVREQTFHWLTKSGITFIPSQSNCFMLDTKRQAGDVISAMAKQDVVIGRVWPIWPTWVRITVGTQPEMEKFQAALGKVMSGAVSASVSGPKPKRSRVADGVIRLA
jgi:histidinol-phosphate/aromatic aminotransferase/cobyric acid decarboxylase-like protein